MAFRDCINSARDQGAITPEEADDLIRRYEEAVRANGGAANPGAAAKEAMAKHFDAAAALARRQAELGAERRDAITAYLTEYRDPTAGGPDVFTAALNLIENYGHGAAVSSISGRAKAIVSLAHGMMADVLSTFRRSRLTGRRFERPLGDDVVREMLGEATARPEARAMADQVAATFEWLRQRFNAAGGAIGQLDRYLPQHHDPRALLRAGYDQWRDFVRPRLDTARMRDPLTDGPLSAERLEESLRITWERVTTDGWVDRTPVAQPFGLGAVANQRGEHRFLHFRSAADWLAYDAAFGRGDPFKAIFGHINGMARDIAAMEVLGPNPGATVEWLKQVVQHELGKAIAGRPSLYRAAGQEAAKLADTLNYAPFRIQALYDYVRGREVVSGRTAIAFGNVRNVLTSALLGSTSLLAASTDPFIDMAARRISGLPATKALWGIVNAVFARQTREQAVRSGIILDDFLHVMGDEARYAGTLGGAEWSRWLADRTVNLNGLEAITQARRHTFALDFQAALADHAGTGFDALPPYLARTLGDYGLGAAEWDALRATPLFHPEPGSAGFLRPIDVADRTLALRYLEMILGQTERAVPTGTARARSLITAGTPRGSAVGELLESGLQFKSFALSFTTLQWQALSRELHQGAAAGAAYAGSISLGLFLGGALALQLRQIATGKDPMPMDSPKFWLQSMLAGGGLGILGDFLLADASRFGFSLQEQLLGPTLNLGSDAWKLTVGNAHKALLGKKTSVGRDAVNLVGRYTPVASSLFYLRQAYRRVVIDQLQYLVDPQAHKNWRDSERRLRRENRQRFYWRPGSLTPERPPNLGAALGVP